MPDSKVGRRDFFKIGGAAAVSMGTSAKLNATSGGASAVGSVSAATQFPKLALITDYSPHKLQFAASAGYEGVVLSVEGAFDPDKLSDPQIDQVRSTAQQPGGS